LDGYGSHEMVCKLSLSISGLGLGHVSSSASASNFWVSLASVICCVHDKRLADQNDRKLPAANWYSQKDFHTTDKRTWTTWTAAAGHGHDFSRCY